MWWCLSQLKENPEATEADVEEWKTKARKESFGEWW